MSIIACPVPECGVLHDLPAGADNEPCFACWREGWRVDGFGKAFRELVRVQPHPADDVHVE